MQGTLNDQYSPTKEKLDRIMRSKAYLSASDPGHEAAVAEASRLLELLSGTDSADFEGGATQILSSAEIFGRGTK